MYNHTGMLASELIAKLQVLVDQHGDLEVHLPSCEWPVAPLESVVIGKQDTGDKVVIRLWDSKI